MAMLFRGDRTQPFAGRLLNSLIDARSGHGPGPTLLDCLLFAGHMGVSVDGGSTIYGFHPGGNLPAWELLDHLQDGNAQPSVVHDDTAVFATAQLRGLAVQSIEVILPEPRYSEFVMRLDGERNSSQYSYGFPNGNGDCNCATWLERLGLPLLTGRMDEYCRQVGTRLKSTRRFGECQ